MNWVRTAFWEGNEAAAFGSGGCEDSSAPAILAATWLQAPYFQSSSMVGEVGAGPGAVGASMGPTGAVGVPGATAASVGS